MLFWLDYIVPFERAIPSKDEIREMVLSWQINDAVKLALNDSDVLLMIIDLLGDGDRNTRIRAVMALYEVLKRCDTRTKFLVLRNGLEGILLALNSRDHKLRVKALKALSSLVDGIRLPEKDFLAILDAIVELAESPGFELVSFEVSDVVAKLTVSSPTQEVRLRIDSLLSREDPWLRAIGLRLFLNVFVSANDTTGMVPVLRGIVTLLPTEDEALLDFILTTLQGAVEKGVPPESLNVIPNLLSKLREIYTGDRGFFIRSKARNVSMELSSLLSDYYRSRPEEVVKLLDELLRRGEREVAMEVAASLRDEFLIRRLSKTIGEEAAASSSFSLGATEMSSQYVGDSPSSLSSSSSSIVDERGEIRSLPAAEGAGLPPLESIVEEGDVSALAELLSLQPQTASRLVEFLSSPQVEVRSNALWILSKLAARLNRGEYESLHILVPSLLLLLESKNPWERSKAAKILALIASKGGKKDIARSILKLLDERPVPALEFFGYYFLYTWDDDVVPEVLRFLETALKNPELQFHALMTLDALTIWGERPEIDKNVFIPILMGLLEVRDEEIRKIAARIMERFKAA